MISLGLQTRPAEPSDQQQLADFLYFEGHVHRHLDWRSPLDWIGSRYYWVLTDQQRRINAALACPQDPPGVAWFRLFTFNSHLSGLEAWSPLWEAARGEIELEGGAIAAAIAVKPWFQDILEKSGFVKQEPIVMLDWTAQLTEPRPLPHGIAIRPMHADDLPAVVETDASAFPPLWQNSLLAIGSAFSLAKCATVAESAGGVVGYQISTGNMLGAHLARLAVRKEAQGKGIGSALVDDLILRLRPNNLARISVNTQSDNTASLALYRRMGFVQTGEKYPVYVQHI